MTNELDAYLWNSYMGRPPQGEPNKPNEHGRFGVKFPDRSVLGVVTVEHVGDFEIVLQRVLPEPEPGGDMTTEPQTAAPLSDLRLPVGNAPWERMRDRIEAMPPGTERTQAVIDLNAMLVVHNGLLEREAATRARSGLDAGLRERIEAALPKALAAANALDGGADVADDWYGSEYVMVVANHVASALASSGEAASVDGLREALLDIAENANHSPSLHPDGSATHCGPCMAYRVLAREDADDDRS